MVGCEVQDQVFKSSSSFYASHWYVFLLGLILTLCPSLTSCVPEFRVKCENISSEYQHCRIDPAGVHDLDCYGKYSGSKKCEWKPGKATSGRIYKLITRQPAMDYCKVYSNITKVFVDIKIYSNKNMTAEIFETSKSAVCTKAVFRGPANSWIRCGPPNKVSFQRHSGTLHVNVSWPREEKDITNYSVKYKTLKSQSWDKIPVGCQSGSRCVVKKLSPSLFYNVQMQCVANGRCEQCPPSETFTVPPELTTRPEIDIIQDKDIAEKKGTRLLFLTWTFSAKEPYDGYRVTVWKASGEVPAERMNITKPEVRLVLSYSEFHVSISAVNSVSVSPAANQTIPQREDASGVGGGRLNVTVHSNKAFTVHWKKDLTKTYVCYSVEWRRKGDKVRQESFYERKDKSRLISLSDHLEPYERYDITLHTRPNKDTCNMKRINNSESTYGSTQFYFAEGTPVSAPANVSSYNVSLNSVALEWSPITEQDARGFLLGYTIHYTAYRPRGAEINVTVQAPSSRHTLEGLTSNTAYEVQISGFTRAGSGVRSRAHIFKTHQEIFYLHPSIFAPVFAVVMAVLILGPVIIKRTKVAVWPSIPDPGSSNAMQKIQGSCELELLESINTLKVQEWDTSSLQVVEKETVMPPPDEGDTCSWSQSDSEGPPGGLPPDSSRAPHLQSHPLNYLSEYTTMETFNQVTPWCVSKAERSESEDADVTALQSELHYIRQLSSSPTLDSEVSTFL